MKSITTEDSRENGPAPKSVPAPGTRALSKGLDILKMLAESPRFVRFNELLEASDLPKGTLHRVLAALIDARMVRINKSDHTYRLGTSLFEMAHKVWSDFDLRGSADPELRRLKNLARETARLAILDDDKVLIIDQNEFPHPLRLGQNVGTQLATHASALGKALLSRQAPERLHSILRDHEFRQLTPHTITDADSLRHHLDLTVARGYAISIEEQFLGVSSVAAPILDHKGEAIGAIGVAGASFRLPKDTLHVLGRDVLESARRVSGNVGEAFMSIIATRKPKRLHVEALKCIEPSNAFLGEAPHWIPNYLHSRMSKKAYS